MFLLVSTIAQASVDIAAKPIGHLTSVGNQQTRTFHQYDAQGRPVATQYVQDGQSSIFTLTYGYAQSTSGPGRVLASQTFPDGERVTNTYDGSGAQVAMTTTLGTVSQDILRDYRTNARGQATRIELGNGTLSTLSYNEGGNMNLALTTTSNAVGQKVQEYGYTYDDNGNVTRVSDGVRTDQSATLTYDSLDQLTGILNSSGNVIEQYAYDAIGNLTQKGALIQTYGAGGRPHALSASGGVPYGYDRNGNVTTIGGSTTLEWNAENMSSKVTTGMGVTEKFFVGESLWKKVEGGVTTYLLPGLRLENGVARKYYGSFAERLEPPGDRQLRFYHPDHLGSSSVMTDEGGNVIHRVSYFPWGQERGVEGTFTPKYQFNFKEKDGTGFYDYGARLYSPLTGRWLSPDVSLADGSNRYAYVRNNPWTRSDPDGHKSRIWIECSSCNGGKPMIMGWDGDTIPKGWNEVSFNPKFGYVIVEDKGVYRQLNSNGTFDIVTAGGEFVRHGSDDELRQVSREQAEAMAASGGSDGAGMGDAQADAINAIGNNMAGIPVAVAAVWGASVLVGLAVGGALVYMAAAAGHTVTSMFITETATVDLVPTVIGGLARTAEFVGEAYNTLKVPFYAYNAGVQLTWMEEVVRAGGLVIVAGLKMAGPITIQELNYFIQNNMHLLYIP
jgi:RHS repeat-associated protein